MKNPKKEQINKKINKVKKALSHRVLFEFQIKKNKK